VEPAAWPTGTVTFLVTDIEGSTRLWEQRADMRDLVERHLAALRTLVAAHGGLTFSSAGDGIAAGRRPDGSRHTTAA
jgi:class 3 adenylate cyclase